ncbi:AraC family transcriptional regulator [Kiritimatiellota bacterium B12222]|nr:AraC family transcriptional regulator [Kiritimatiellota bacterium B12222]
MKPKLLHLGYFISPVGGATQPSIIRKNEGLFEMVTHGRVKHPEKDQWVGPGWIFFHRPGELTIYRSPDNEHYECMTASFRLNQEEGTWPRGCRWDDGGDAADFAREILYAFHQEGISLEVLGELIWSQFMFRRMQHALRKSDSRIPARMAAVIDEISLHPAAEHRIETLAAKIGMSPSHLHAEFKASTGKTPHQMVIQYRMAAARHKLATTMDPVKAIAFDVGFSNTENFCRAFKKHTGLTAAAFRKKYMRYD